MKRLLLILTCSAMAVAGAELSSVRSVYLFPMGHSLDQYLANRLTSEHVFQVVTDPKLADAVFTDRIGDAFEEKLDDLNAPPVSSKPAEPSPKPAEPPAAKQNTGDAPPPLPTETVNKLSNPATSSTFGHGKGTIFLVDRKSKQVIWSYFEPMKEFGSSQLDHSAFDIVSHLKKDIKKLEGNKP